MMRLILSSLVLTLLILTPAAALLEKFGLGSGLFRNGEITLQPGFASIGGLYGQYVKALAELARVDFDRTKSAADNFQRDEVRLMARLVIAQSVLSDRLDTGDIPYGEGIFGGGGGVMIEY